jgi:thioredoxin-dependent peroxiredoxin
MALLATGTQAPDFTVNDQDGIPFRLADQKGKKIVLYFYPKDLTETCTNQACNLRDNYQSLRSRGYEIIGISSDNEKSHRKFIAKEKLPFRLLADVDKHVHHLYGTWIEKQLYGRTYMGTARVTYLIDEKGMISEVIEKVNSKNHAAQILGEPIPPVKRGKIAAKVTSKKKTAPRSPAKAKKRKK